MIGLGLRLRRRAEKRVTDEQLSKAIAALPPDHPFRKSGPGLVVGGESLFNRADASPQPTFTPAPREVRETRPIPVALPLRRGRHTASTAARASADDQDKMQRAWWSLRSLDLEALDAAKATQGATYAGVRWAADPLTAPDWPVDASEPARLHDEILGRRAPVLGPDRFGHGDAARRRADSLAYPPCDGTGTAAAYAGVLRLASAITGTTGAGLGQWWQPALESAA